MTPTLAFELEVYEADLGRMEFEPYRRAIRMSIPPEIPSPNRGTRQAGAERDVFTDTPSLLGLETQLENAMSA
ncbi:hypothetical protein AYJ54_00045 [Bradyrhizobium centrolobii]|uniref:Uncharacterized protein n=1 Tax=Bradyrhizobium centrolobii TaxID=1505087 RepID=A0A176YRW9_9BRAD|nr:hypothetical protein AYJ54_00045 [Bradyrhizobium centrolobii]